jgi:2-C-methyl-D-erythritol 2,4-cyclodiphosphate synthase
VIADPRLAVRSGIGYDSHRFAPGGPLTLGGIAIPSDVHLYAHSDGDAIAHAATDAILGAVALGDIGTMFADTDPANAGRDSIEMLQLATARLNEAGWRVQQLDVIVIAETPKIALHRDAMRDRIAHAVGLERGDVSIKGKTNEGMGFVGRGEGIACMATATVVAK